MKLFHTGELLPFFCLLCLYSSPTNAQVTALGEKKLVEKLAKSSPTFQSAVPIFSKSQGIAPDGAVGRNRSFYVMASEQRHVQWQIMLGIIDNAPPMFHASTLAMEYAFSKQTPAGDFENKFPNPKAASLEDAVFFLQSYARTHLVLKDSPSWGELRGSHDKLLPKLKLSMQWLAQESHIRELMRGDSHAANRLWFDAMTFYLNGIILDDASLRQHGENFIKLALESQRPDGSFDEHNGADSSYQAVSIRNICILLCYIRDESLASSLRKSLRSAVAWELSKVNSDGSISVAGNSRTGLGQEKFFGKAKGVNHREIVEALYFSSALEDNAEWLRAADKVASYVIAPKDQ